MEPWGSARQFAGVVQKPPAQVSAATRKGFVSRMVEMAMMGAEKRML
jgi:hypothetical protein